MYQGKQFRKLNCWLEIFSTTKIPAKNMTISHRRMLKKYVEIGCKGLPQPSLISLLISNCNEMVLKLKYRSTEIN